MGMQIVLRCARCAKMTVTDDSADTCLEIDARDAELRFICRSCKHPNVIGLKPKQPQRPPILGLSG